MAKEDKTDGLNFWEHLDVLRTAIVKIVAVAVVFGIAAFCFKEKLFAVILAPKNDGFITYRLFNRIAAWAGGETGSFAVQLINTGLAGQFVIHMKTALCAGVLCASPISFTSCSGSCRLPVCLRAEICRADSRRRLCNVPDGCGGQLLSYFPADIPFPWNLSGQR